MSGNKVTIDLSKLSQAASSVILAVLRISTVPQEKKKQSAYYPDPYYPSRMQSPYREAILGVYKLYHNSADWRRNRETVLERNGGLCSECGKRPASVVHHTSYDNWALGEQELGDLKGLCGRCSAKAHKRGSGNATPFFARRYPELGYIPRAVMAAWEEKIQL